MFRGVVAAVDKTPPMPHSRLPEGMLKKFKEDPRPNQNEGAFSKRDVGRGEASGRHGARSRRNQLTQGS
ncbi:unnamed protein product [Mesocestoides corti]|nr:unnamed protein product [Mesocestoides corti]